MKSTFFHLKKSLLIENFKTHRFQFKNLSINSVNNESSSKSEIIQKLQKKVEQIELKDETREDNITKSKNTIIKSNQRRKLINKSRYINFSKLPDSVLPRVALIGRPNVGKSALFNKLSKTPKAIVYDTPGVTRDRLFVRCYWGSREFLLIDTGGIPDKTTINDLEKKSQIFDSVIINEMALNDVNKDDIPEGIEKQLVSSLLESECIVFVADGKEGLANGDVEILTWMRKFLSEKHIFLAVNKCDDLRCADVKLSTFWEMGLEPIPVSAMTGSGTGDLLDKIIKVLPKFRIGANLNKNEEEEEETIVTIIGRPNTGKSSMLNALIGDDRSIVSKIPGTTRDSIDCTTELHGGHLVRLVDTAGIRRRMAVTGSKDKVEKLMVKSALRSIRRCNVVILMIDCVEGITNQDLKIVKLASDEGKAIVLIANKFDLLNKKDWNKEKLEAILKLRLRESEWAQIVITSLKRDPVTGNYIGEDIKSEFRKLPVFKNISRAILDADQNHSKRINTATLNSIVQDAVHFKQPPSGKGGRHGKIYYATQTSVRPPTFVMFVNDEALINDDYKKYLEKQLRDTIDFSGTTIKVLFKGKPPRPDKIYNNDKNIKMLQYNKM